MHGDFKSQEIPAFHRPETARFVVQLQHYICVLQSEVAALDMICAYLKKKKSLLD